MKNKLVFQIGCSSDKIDLFKLIAQQFNNTEFHVADGSIIEIICLDLPTKPIKDVLDACCLDAVSPETSIWLQEIDESNIKPDEGFGSLAPTLYAASPIVMMMWQGVAASMGFPKRGISWSDIVEKSFSDRRFRWGMTASDSLIGQLIILSMGADENNNYIDNRQLQSSEFKSKIRKIQRKVTYYSPNEIELFNRVSKEGHDFLDLFISQEHLAIRFNKENKNRLVIVSPESGTIWADHPIAFWTRSGQSESHIDAYRQFCTYLVSSDVQAFFLENGFHPIGPHIASFLSAENKRIDYGLENIRTSSANKSFNLSNDMSSASIRDIFLSTKRNTNILLAVDTSSSMDGEKLELVKQAIYKFISNIGSDEDRFGLIRFDSHVEVLVRLKSLSVNRNDLLNAVKKLYSRGNTALIDAIEVAYSSLLEYQDDDRINAIIVLTDGQENESKTSLESLIFRMNEGNTYNIPVFTYGIAYGRDADQSTLQQIASATHGKVYFGDSTSIHDVWDFLSRMM